MISDEEITNHKRVEDASYQYRRAERIWKTAKPTWDWIPGRDSSLSR